MGEKKKVTGADVSKWLLKMLLAGCTAFVLLNLFALIYSNQGVHITNTTGATDYIWEPGTFFSRMTEGHTYGHIDKNGFNNSYPMEDEVDILLMGSSHMEAFHMPQDKNAGYLLNEFLHQNGAEADYVYNIGTSGHGFTDCLSNLPYALAEYQPQKAVVIETMTLDFTEAAMSAVLDGTRQRIPSYDSGMIYHLQKVPYLKAAYNQMESLLKKQKGAVDLQVSPEAQELSPAVYAAEVGAMLKQASDRMGDRTLIVFYHPSLYLREDGSAYTKTDPGKRKIFQEICEENGILFLDMTERFMTEYENEYVLPYGFLNSAVGTGHLNQDGHRMIAEELHRVLKEMETGK